ncbi:MAG: hypothetical protein IJQ63_07430 [Synergistaceae bacterium]|nr:hypothetical protein [Synergistaceae bacterium]
MALINEEHKDRVFKFIFGNPDNKEWTLNLYNAVNGSDYKNPDDIEFNTIENAVYLGMKNDVSFIIMSEINLWEHQSSYNPNMPMRFFIYAAKLYEKYIAGSEYYQYSGSLQSAPRPKCVCFYNGTARQPDIKVLKLSDAFGGEADIEVKVTMLNINYGRNKILMEACRPLNEYAWLVDAVRRHQKTKKNLEAAVDAAIAEMPDDFSIKNFLLLNKAEVKGMFLTEYDQEKVLEQERRDSERRGEKRGFNKGLNQGLDQGLNQAHEQTAKTMLKKGEPLGKIAEYSCLAEDVIRALAEKIGVAIA